jgi:glycerophosphoryl diester phosphodiesterase
MLGIPLFILLKMSHRIYLAHRGSWHGHAIENTIEAFEHTKKRLSNHLHGFECDLQQLDHNNPHSWVIFHDKTMDRFNKTQSSITPQVPLISNQTTSKMPTLKAFTEWIKSLTQPIIINIEIKHGTKNGLNTLIRQLSTANAHQRVTFIYSSFDKEVMKYLSSTKQCVSYLIKEMNDFKRLNITDQTNVQFIGIRYDHATPLIFNQLKEKNLSAGIYFKDRDQCIAHIQSVANNGIVSCIFIED